MEIAFTVIFCTLLFGIIVWITRGEVKRNEYLWSEIHKLEKRADEVMTLEEILPIWEDMEIIGKQCIGNEYQMKKISIMAAVLRTKSKILKSQQ